MRYRWSRAERKGHSTQTSARRKFPRATRWISPAHWWFERRKYSQSRRRRKRRQGPRSSAVASGSPASSTPQLACRWRGERWWECSFSGAGISTDQGDCKMCHPGVAGQPRDLSTTRRSSRVRKRASSNAGSAFGIHPILEIVLVHSGDPSPPARLWMTRYGRRLVNITTICRLGPS